MEMVTILYELEGRRLNLEMGVKWIFFDNCQEINFQTKLPLEREYILWIVNAKGETSKAYSMNEKTDSW